LEAIAKAYNYVWGKRANVQELINAIAEGKFQISPSEGEQGKLEAKVYRSRKEIEHLTQAFWTLRDSGQMEQAETIANILLQQYKISEALKQHLNSLPQNNHNQSISEAIAAQTPFTLTYQSASGKGYSFDIAYAEIRLIERHYYLCCWAVEDTGKGEIPALSHNMTLRLDRIKDAVAFPRPGMEWREEGLDSVIVEMQMLGGWTNGYEPKPEDISVEKNDAGIIVRRKVEFWHWAKRQILNYGGDCIILSPEDVRGLIVEETAKMSANYRGVGQ
jgi:hypothetical protein